MEDCISMEDIGSIESSGPITKNTWLIDMPLYVIPYKGYISYSISSNVKESGILKDIENLIISSHLYEPNTIINITFWIQSTLDYCKQTNMFPNLKKVYVLYDSNTLDHDEINSYNYIFNKVFVPYYLLRSTLTEKKALNFSNKDWTPNNKKALFLIGDCLRINRFPVLYEFYKNKKLDKLEYSLDFNYINRFEDFTGYSNSTVFNEFSAFINSAYRLDSNVFTELVKSLQKTLPEDEFKNTISLRDPVVFDHFEISAYCYPREYLEASLILTTESLFFKHPGLNFRNKETTTFSEKTWKPILSKKPFILCDELDFSYSKLESMGFKTFLEYTCHPDKLSTPFSDLPEKSYYPRIAYERTCSLLDNMVLYEDRISADIEHNYKLWLELGTKAWTNLYNQCPPLKNLIKEEVANIFMMGRYGSYITELGYNTYVFGTPPLIKE